LPRGLGPALDELDPRCVVSWEYGPATLRSLAWCGRRGRPLVVFSELTPVSERELPPLQLRLHRALARRARGFLAASSSARERLLRMGVPPERIEVSLQSADVGRLRAAAGPHARRPDGPVRVLAVGRLVPDKNVALLIEAFAEAGLYEGEAELELCGSGPLERELREAARRLRVPASFRGYVEPAELPARYAQADLLALVSTYEPFGVAVREAVAAGRRSPRRFTA
jgi:glycosyltransferase involved in cell wall biosynthesis